MPRLLVDRRDFRIVQDVIDGNEIFVLEVPNGADALGVERWRTFEQANASIRAVVRFLIDLALEQERVDVERGAAHGKRS